MNDAFHAFRLPPGVAPGELELREGRLPFRYPQPTHRLLDATLSKLRAAGRVLAGHTVHQIVDAVDAAAGHIADPRHPLGGEARRLVPLATGYSQAMADLVIQRMAADWRRERLLRLLEADLGDSAALDGFVPAGKGRRTRAYPPGLSFHVFSGNVPGVGVTSLVRSLLVKGAVLAKVASDEPVLPTLFARALDAVDPEIAAAVAITYWPGGSHDVEARVLAGADLVVVYGGEGTVASLRQRAPAGRRLVVHGPRFSTGLIAGTALDEDPGLPEDAARAVATFDQQGCVSPHALWLEDPAGNRADAFADAVARALEALEHELPRGILGPGEAGVIQQERGAAELRTHALGRGRVISGSGTTWTVVLDPEPVFRPSCLNRFVRIHPVEDLEEAVAALARHGEHIQSAAIAAPEARRLELADRLARVGVTRVTSFRTLPWPPPEWHHDGGEPLRELVRWVDLED
jgi:hypothetical protein